MAAYIPAFVIEKGSSQVYINSAYSIGAIQEIPTPDGGGVLETDVWAIPINHGVYGGFNFRPYNASNPKENVQPPMSVAAVKISSRLSGDWWIVLGTAAQYITAAGGGAALPAVWPALSHTIPLLPVCNTLNKLDATGKYLGNWGIPSFDLDPLTIQALFPYGFFNNVALPAATANGYTTVASLLVFLNTATVNTGTAANPVYTGGWAVVGTWTATADGLTLIVTQTAGPGTDVACMALVAIIPSA